MTPTSPPRRNRSRSRSRGRVLSPVDEDRAVDRRTTRSKSRSRALQNESVPSETNEGSPTFVVKQGFYAPTSSVSRAVPPSPVPSFYSVPRILPIPKSPIKNNPKPSYTLTACPSSSLRAKDETQNEHVNVRKRSMAQTMSLFPPKRLAKGPENFQNVGTRSQYALTMAANAEEHLASESPQPCVKVSSFRKKSSRTSLLHDVDIAAILACNDSPTRIDLGENGSLPTRKSQCFDTCQARRIPLSGQSKYHDNDELKETATCSEFKRSTGYVQKVTAVAPFKWNENIDTHKKSSRRSSILNTSSHSIKAVDTPTPNSNSANQSNLPALSMYPTYANDQEDDNGIIESELESQDVEETMDLDISSGDLQRNDTDANAMRAYPSLSANSISGNFFEDTKHIEYSFFNEEAALQHPNKTETNQQPTQTIRTASLRDKRKSSGENLIMVRSKNNNVVVINDNEAEESSENEEFHDTLEEFNQSEVNRPEVCNKSEKKKKRWCSIS